MNKNEYRAAYMKRFRNDREHPMARCTVLIMYAALLVGERLAHSETLPTMSKVLLIVLCAYEAIVLSGFVCLLMLISHKGYDEYRRRMTAPETSPGTL